MKLLFYGYDRCGTCIKAIKFLEAHNISYQKIAIREQPPNLKELKRMLQGKSLNKLFNTSGKDYREQQWKTKITNLPEEVILKEMTKNGNLIKRPFLLSSDGKVALVGFKEDEWSILISK